MEDMGTEENAEQVGYTTVSVGLSSHPNHLPLGYLGETGEEAHDKTGRLFCFFSPSWNNPSLSLDHNCVVNKYLYRRNVLKINC